MNPQKKTSPWAWIPTLYFAQGLPYVAVMTISVIMYKRIRHIDTDIALYTSWLYLPWVIKPFWSPFIDLLKTKRWWVVTMQMLVGAGLAGIAFTIPAPHFFQITLAIFWLVAFSSATHDIAADGFYMLALDTHDQAMYVGIRSTFYRVAHHSRTRSAGDSRRIARIEYRPHSVEPRNKGRSGICQRNSSSLHRLPHRRKQ